MWLRFSHAPPHVEKVIDLFRTNRKKQNPNIRLILSSIYKFFFVHNILKHLVSGRGSRFLEYLPLFFQFWCRIIFLNIHVVICSIGWIYDVLYQVYTPFKLLFDGIILLSNQIYFNKSFVLSETNYIGSVVRLEQWLKLRSRKTYESEFWNCKFSKSKVQGKLYLPLYSGEGNNSIIKTKSVIKHFVLKFSTEVDIDPSISLKWLMTVTESLWPNIPILEILFVLWTPSICDLTSQ